MSPGLLSEKYVRWDMGRKELVSLCRRRKREREAQGRRKAVSRPGLPSSQSLPLLGFTRAPQPRNEKASGACSH